MEGGENDDMHTVMENFQKKNNMVTGRSHVSHHPQVTTSSQVNFMKFFFVSLDALVLADKFVRD